MISLLEALAEIDIDLRQLNVRWALVGGLAVSVRAEPRTTKDVDLAVAVEGDHEAERIIADFKARGYRMLQEPFERTDQDRMSTVRLIAQLKTGRIIADFLFASSGTEPEIVNSAEPIEVLPGVTIPVIKMGHLLAVKPHAARHRDLADVQALWLVCRVEALARRPSRQ